MKNNLDELKNTWATNLFGMTKNEAVKKNICINCKNSVEGRIYSAAGEREYKISGMCELCFDALFA